MKRIYFGDNLQVMSERDSERVDIICTDPPFNSGVHYNVFLPGSKAQVTAFSDIWIWDDAAIENRDYVREQAERYGRYPEAYQNLERCLKGYDLVLDNAATGWQGATRAYMAFMGPRIVEMHRLLKPTGSIYLHCDPTMSHYLKVMMDAVFGQENFQNEVIWSYNSGGGTKSRYGRKHDTLLFYSKGGIFTFNADEVRVPYASVIPDKWAENFNEKGKVSGDVLTIRRLANRAKERLGYPTQKPRELYEFLIKASSNEGDIVFDPFCGCGTTLDAAEALNRQWSGIDITIFALEPVQRRLLAQHGLRPGRDYEIFGYPTNLQEAKKLARDHKRPHDFERWAVTRLGLEPTPASGDRGIDGVLPTVKWNPRKMEQAPVNVVAQVKSNGYSVSAIRDFRTAMRDKNADIGVFIALDGGNPTPRMREQQEAEGTIEHNGKQYYRLQFWSVDDKYFNNPESVNRSVQLPWRIEPTYKLDRGF